MVVRVSIGRPPAVVAFGLGRLDLVDQQLEASRRGFRDIDMHFDLGGHADAGTGGRVGAPW
jgi:hypothetical protein